MRVFSTHRVPAYILSAHVDKASNPEPYQHPIIPKFYSILKLDNQLRTGCLEEQSSCGTHGGYFGLCSRDTIGAALHCRFGASAVTQIVVVTTAVIDGHLIGREIRISRTHHIRIQGTVKGFQVARGEFPGSSESTLIYK